VVFDPVAYEGRDAQWRAEVDRGGRYMFVCHLAEAGTAFMCVCVAHIPGLVAPLNCAWANAAGERIS
jgi:hypothetical protein